MQQQQGHPWLPNKLAVCYNEEHGNVKKPTISYFRCYEVVDSNCNTKGWYLHFFCNSGGCDDNKLKSLYG